MKISTLKFWRPMARRRRRGGPPAAARSTGSQRDAKGQSLVELTLTLPVLIILLAGIVEIAVGASNYLITLDAAREGARYGSEGNPMDPPDANHNCDPSAGTTTTDFYWTMGCPTQRNMFPLTLNPATDDIVISAFAVEGGNVLSRTLPSNPPTYKCSAGKGNDSSCSWSMFGNHQSDFTSVEFQNLLDFDDPPNGLVTVEVFYDHHWVIGLPALGGIFPPYFTLHPYVVMPLASFMPME